jgi:DNA polymerase-1
MITALLDGDSFVYLAALAAATDEWDGTPTIDMDAGILYLTTEVEKVLYHLGADRVIMTFSDHARWRNEVLPTYKANRKAEKPLAYVPLLEYVAQNYEVRQFPGLEGDDVMGILATHPTLLEGDKVIVSVDKDMRTVPGALFNPRKEEFEYISKDDALRAFYMQCLTGDTADGYKGCPGIGPKKAEKIIYPFFDEFEFKKDDLWEAIVKTYESKKLTEEDALKTAQVARICQHEDFDLETNTVRLWTPY